MKRTFLTTICAGLLLGGYAQSKIDLQSQVTLKEELNFKIPRYNPQTRSIGKGKANPQRTKGLPFTRRAALTPNVRKLSGY